MTQSFYRKTALGLSREYERQVGTQGHLATRKCMISAQYNVLWREGCTATLQSCLSLPNCPSAHPQTCALLIIHVPQHLCLQSRITTAACLEKHSEILRWAVLQSVIGYIHCRSDRLQMNPTVGTEVSQLVSPHPAVLVFNGQPSCKGSASTFRAI